MMRISRLKTNSIFSYPIICSILFSILIVFFAAPAFAAKKKDKKQPPAQLTLLQLQSELMSFADRLGSILYEAYYLFEGADPPDNTRLQAAGDIAASVLATVTIVAGPNPEIALVDLMILTTLGRKMYEEHWQKVYGKKPLDIIVLAFKDVEKDVWNIGSRVLTAEQQQELRSLITRWRQDHPDYASFAYIRFADFATGRYQSTLVADVQKRGLLAPVNEAARQIEESRMLAERAMFLGTRYPLLAGNLIDLWLSDWLLNPEFKTILADLNSISESSKEFGNLARDLPEILRKERAATVDHLMDRLAIERKNTINNLVSEKEQVEDLLVELRRAITEANALMVASNELARKLGLEEDSPGTFDINDYRKTLEEATASIKELRTLMESPGLEKFFPRVDKTFALMEKEGEELVNYTALIALGLIVIGMAFFILAQLIIRFLTLKLFDSGKQKD